MRSNRELLAAAHQAFNARDFEAVLAMLHPDVDWPNRIEGGRIPGRDNVREY
jgi:ketosteroid isomerase-like protein